MGEGRETRLVTLTKPFFLGIYEVTDEEFYKVIGKTPSGDSDSKKPVSQVSWEDANDFCKKLSMRAEEGAAGRVYRLPTDAEWEYACRAGSTTKYCCSDNSQDLKNYAWFIDNSRASRFPVGQKKPNAWGFYDMHGNVWEWCSDWYRPDTYERDAARGMAVNPRGPAESHDPAEPGQPKRVQRGGSFLCSEEYCARYIVGTRGKGEVSSGTNHCGFRCVKTPER